MAVSVTHAKVSTVPDDGDASEVLPSDWNAAHTVTGLATVAETGAYSDLSGKPTLGTAAAQDVGYFATAAQGALADSALQASAIGVSVQAYDADLTAWAGVNPSSFSTTAQIAAAYQPLDSDLTAFAALSPSNDDFVQRKAGAWTNRTVAQVLTDLAAAGTTFQPLDADLTTLAGLTATTDNFIVSVSSAWASRTPSQVRTTLGLVVGTDVQAYSSVLANTTASFTTTLETKLNGIEALADVTDATNVAAAGAVMESDTSTASMSFVIDEDSFASNSATKVPTQQSVKAYVDAEIAGVGAGWTTISGPTSLSGASVSVTSIPQTYSEIMLSVTGGMSHNSGSNQTYSLEFSMDNGSSWETAFNISTSLAGSVFLRGATMFIGYSLDAGIIINGMTSGTNDTLTTYSNTWGAQHSGGIDALRISVGGGSFDSGSITLLGR